MNARWLDESYIFLKIVIKLLSVFPYFLLVFLSFYKIRSYVVAQAGYRLLTQAPASAS